jgi:hypothetical protein
MKTKKINSIVDFQPSYNENLSHIYCIFSKDIHQYNFLASIKIFYKRFYWLKYTSDLQHFWYLCKSIVKPLKCILNGHYTYAYTIKPELDIWKQNITIGGWCPQCQGYIYTTLENGEEIINTISNKVDIVCERNIIFRRLRYKSIILDKVHRAAKYRQLARFRKEYKMADMFRSILDKYDYTIEEYKDGTYKIDEKDFCTD